MSYKVIAVDVRYRKPLEGIAGGTIPAGALIQPSGSNWVVHAVAGGSSNYIADYLMEESIADSFLNTEFLPYLAIAAGDLVNMPLAIQQTVAKGAKLTSNGDGYLKVAVTGVQNLGNATNYVPLTPVGNNVVSVSFVDPSANTQALAVTIDGNFIKVALATDGGGAITSTPALIKAAIEAVDGYDSLVTVGTVGGTAAILADEAVLQADEVFGFAEVAVTTTTVVSRVLVRKGA